MRTDRPIVPLDDCRFYMGLDLSVRGAGMVVIDSNGQVQDYGLWGGDLGRKSSVREKVDRLIYIATRIIQGGKKVPDWENRLEVGIENYAFGAKGNQTDLGEIQGVVRTQLWMALHKTPEIIVASSARKKVLGKGRFSKGKKGKKEIISAVSERFGRDWGEDHDLADAHVIAEHLRKMREE